MAYIRQWLQCCHTEDGKSNQNNHLKANNRVRKWGVSVSKQFGPRTPGRVIKMSVVQNQYPAVRVVSFVIQLVCVGNKVVVAHSK